MPLTEIFLFSSFTFIIFLHKDIFSLKTTYDIPFLQIHTFFLLASRYVINVNQ